MKKFITIILALILVLAFAACEKKDESEVSNMTNPWENFESLEALNEKALTNFVKPPVMGVSDEVFRYLDAETPIAEYQFKVNGIPYTIRSAATLDDISGVYTDNGTAFEGVETDVDRVMLDEYKLFRWFSVDGQFVITANDNGQLTEEQFIGICDEIKGTIFVDYSTEGEVSAPDGAMTGMVNPWEDLESLEALNEKAGTNLAKPPVMGVSDEAFRYLNAEVPMAEYKFCVNGIPYFIRTSATLDDISGIYTDNGTAFASADPEIDRVMLDEYKLFRWFSTEGQFVICANDNGQLTEEQFIGICEELKGLIFIDQTA